MPKLERKPDPDFVWVGCGSCWQPQDRTRPVRAYSDWLEDAHRHRSFYCRTCTTTFNQHTEVFPTLWGFLLDQAYPFREGGVVPAAIDVQTWGR